MRCHGKLQQIAAQRCEFSYTILECLAHCFVVDEGPSSENPISNIAVLGSDTQLRKLLLNCIITLLTQQQFPVHVAQYPQNFRRLIRNRPLHLKAVGSVKHWLLTSDQARLAKYNQCVVRKLLKATGEAIDSLTFTIRIAKGLKLHPGRSLMFWDAALSSLLDHVQRLTRLPQ
nr:hypothetical protein KPSA3_100003 [Pseudomonas syringae pv. actinidiae]